MELLLILIFIGAAIVNFFDFKAALWITLGGLLLPFIANAIK